MQAAIVILVGLAAVALTIYTAVTPTSRGKYLCDDCKFNSAELCNKTERPTALICTSYRQKDAESMQEEPPASQDSPAKS